MAKKQTPTTKRRQPRARTGVTSAPTRKRASKASAKTRSAPRARRAKHVFFFGDGKAEGDRTKRDLLGGKGAGLAEMTNAGLPVPPGFTVSTDVCTLFYDGGHKVPDQVEKEMETQLRRLERLSQSTLGSAKDPLLVSVRSGAKFSMPGMMDTILNLGLNDDAVEGLKLRTSNGRFAFDSYRRFIQMFGNVVLEISKETFEHEFDAVKEERGVRLDTQLDERGPPRRRGALQGCDSP